MKVFYYYLLLFTCSIFEMTERQSFGGVICVSDVIPHSDGHLLLDQRLG